MIHFLTALTVVSLTAVDVQLTQLDGQTTAGQLTAITPQQVSMETSQGPQVIPLETVMMIDVTSPASPPGSVADPSEAVQQILLHDGSRFQVTSIIRTAEEFVVRSETLGQLTLPAGAVRAVRLAAEDPAVAGQWQTFLQRDGQKDVLIVPKRDGSGLDFLMGIVAAVNTETVTFLLDGDTIPVPLSRVYGVVFAKPDQSVLQGGSVLHLTTGDQLAGRSVVFADGRFEVISSWQQAVLLEVTALRRIDFSSGRLQYLSDLEPLEERFDGIDPEGSLFAGLIDKETARLMYGPARDSTLDPPQKIRLRNRRYEKGLCVHSRTQLSYALDRQYESFESVVGVDDAVAFNQVSLVSLTISADGKVVFDKVFQTDEDPVTLKLPVADVSTLTILVDYADGDSSCDWLDLADAKLIRITETN